MHKKNRRDLAFRIQAVIFSWFAVLCLVATSTVQALADDAQYKMSEPRLDNAPPIAPPREIIKPKSPLVGNVQHNEKPGYSKGKLMFGGKRDANTPMKARVNDEDNGLKAQVESSIGIIGVKFVCSYGRSPVINEIFPGTPAEKVGLRLYDIIVAVDGVPTAGLTKDEVFDLIVGVPDTPVTLSIMRNGDFHAVNCMRMDINNLVDARVRRDYLIHM